MNAVILAGGFGSRLKPLTENIIKPMLSLANTPMIDYTVAHLSDFGIRDFVFTLSYKPEQIIDFAIGYSDAVCHFSMETYPLGTAGGVKAAESFLDDIFIVVSGDALENIDFNSMLHKHISSNSDVTMAVKEVQNTSLYGVVEFDPWGTVTGFTEKPPMGSEKSKYANCGVYIMNKSVLSFVPKSTKFDFSKDLFPLILEHGKISAFIHEDYWCDIGDVKSYYKANFDVMNKGFFTVLPNSKRFEYSSYHVGSHIRSLISTTSELIGDAINSIIGREARIAKGAYIENCIVMDNTVVKGRYSDSIIAPNYCISLSQNEYPLKNLQNSSKNFNYFM